MDLFVYSDESGVFDHKHNDYFVFAGLICFGNKQKEEVARRYSHVESMIRESGVYPIDSELKACKITNKDKGKIFRSLNNDYKFCVLIKEKELKKEIFDNKRHKQRYLDYAYKIVLKKCFEQMILRGFLNPNKIDNIHVYVDEHTTATDGKYELRENLLNEFKNGTFNYDWNHFYEPIFPKLSNVAVYFCDSKKSTLVRASDIIANHFYHSVISNNGFVEAKSNTFVYVLPQGVVSSNGFEFFVKKYKR